MTPWSDLNDVYMNMFGANVYLPRSDRDRWHAHLMASPTAVSALHLGPHVDIGAVFHGLAKR
jgi:hypothetical protein